jgi:hypothetical protein
MELFGPIKTMPSCKKLNFDAITKNVELIAVPEKSALTVASALFSTWL